jgi:hypothetical protein
MPPNMGKRVDWNWTHSFDYHEAICYQKWYSNEEIVNKLLKQLSQFQLSIQYTVP